jgi:hypothetical protein
MKTKIIPLLIAAVFVLANLSGISQASEKDLKKDITSKAVKEARKEAKKYEKEGYTVAMGALPMEKQLENAWMKEYETDEQGNPKYIVVTGQSVGETQTAAKLQADETAKLTLAGQISTNIAALIENSIANQQLNPEEAASVTKTVAASKNIIAQELGRVLTLVELYRKNERSVEASVRIAYSEDVAMEMGKKVIRQKLEEETTIAHEKLEKLMEF